MSFAHHGSTGSVIRLALVNLVLNVVTLSLWRFWGKTRVRRLLWSGTVAWGDAAEYTGRGGELFLGFLIALVVVFLPLAVALGVAQTAVEAGNDLAWVAVAAIQLLVVFLAFAGLYRARRYQLSRTVWRGIRAGQDGAAWRYGLLALGVGAATIATLGWALPWAEMRLARHRLNHTVLGDGRFACRARARPLYGRFAVLWLAGAVFVGAIPLGVLMLAFANDHTTPDEQMLTFVVFAVIVALWATLTMALPFAWYRAGFYRELAAQTRFAGIPFRLEATTGGLIRLGLGNWLIGALSLGVLRPWAALRTFRYACRHLRIEGEPDWALVRQGAARPGRMGEGLAAVFDGAGDF